MVVVLAILSVFLYAGVGQADQSDNADTNDSITVILGSEGKITVEGIEVALTDLPAILSQVQDREKVELRFGAQTETLPPAEVELLRNYLLKLSQELKFKDFTVLDHSPAAVDQAGSGPSPWKYWSLRKDMVLDAVNADSSHPIWKEGKNPNDVWSYGHSPQPADAAKPDTTEFKLYTDIVFIYPDLPMWHFLPRHQLFVPAIHFNVSSGFHFGTPPGMVTLHGGGEMRRLSVARWTAPQQGQYMIYGTFCAGDQGNCDYYVIQNQTGVLFCQPDESETRAFDLTVALKAGDTIDFAVGTGTDFYTCDSTPVEAVIAPSTGEKISKEEILGENLFWGKIQDPRVRDRAAAWLKLAGMVQDQAGQPVEGAQVMVCPVQNKGASSDREGKFEVRWDPWRLGGANKMTSYLVARQYERNLAAIMEIPEDNQVPYVTVSPGVIGNGRVVDPDGKEIPNARIKLILCFPNWRAGIDSDSSVITDDEGYFEAKAIPAEYDYLFQANAEGYGKTRKEVHADEAVNGRLDVGTLVLKLANLTLTGVVVDAEDQPVAGANIYGYGDGQPDLGNYQTDEQGKFTLHVCEGKLNIQADFVGTKPMRGNIETEGGVTDVKIVMKESNTRPLLFMSRQVPKEPASLVGKALPDMTALSLAVDPGAMKDQPVLLCFCDMNQRPSRHTVQELVKKAEELKGKGVVVALVQAEPMEQKNLDEWIAKYQIPFAVGVLKDQPDKTKFDWGVKALPWLMLTDVQHVVQAEGFTVTELEEKIQGVRPN